MLLFHKFFSYYIICTHAIQKSRFNHQQSNQSQTPKFYRRGSTQRGLEEEAESVSQEDLEADMIVEIGNEAMIENNDGNEAMIENNDAANDLIEVLPEVATLNV